jgi:hypothetical protein
MDNRAKRRSEPAGKEHLVPEPMAVADGVAIYALGWHELVAPSSEHGQRLNLGDAAQKVGKAPNELLKVRVSPPSYSSQAPEESEDEGDTREISANFVV